MKIRDHSELFKQQDYQEQFERKKEFENCWPPEKVKEISDWTKTEEYKELNFKRENIKINPAKACQPLGAVFCASGFEGPRAVGGGGAGVRAFFPDPPPPPLQGTLCRDLDIDDGRRRGVRGA